MAPVVFNPVKGKIQHLFEQARDTAADVGCLLLLAAGLQGDDALQDHATVAALLAASNDEASFPNYTRKILANPTAIVDTATNRVVMSAAGNPLVIQWDNAGGSGPHQQVGAIVFYYQPTTGAADTVLVPLSAAPMLATTDGTHLVVTIGAGGIVTARNPS